MTLTVLIGNSDDKLTQVEWSNFVRDVGERLKLYSTETHFSGGSAFDARWQNACWVVEIIPEYKDAIRNQLRVIRQAYRQDAAVVVFSNPEFI